MLEAVFISNNGHVGLFCKHFPHSQVVLEVVNLDFCPDFNALGGYTYNFVTFYTWLHSLMFTFLLTGHCG